MNKNINTIEYLDYYCNLEFCPEYAILLRGPWGCGKTWFIKKYIETLKNKKKKVLYISLYGIATCSQIDDIIFQQLHPLASSKYIDLLGSAIKMISPKELPRVNLKNIFKQIENSILVFDDLERCSMNIVSILGYINSFAEHKGNKVIILANEEEISISKKYYKIKEKLIGETFQIKSDFSSTFNSVISCIKTTELKKMYEQSRSIINAVYDEAAYDNLRHLKQALWSFERLYIKFPKYMADKIFFNELLYEFLCFSFELKSGKIQYSDFGSLTKIFLIKSEDEESKRIQNLFKKYDNLKMFTTVLPEKTWESFFKKNEINIKEIQEYLDNSEYFSSKISPKWIQLWHFRSIASNEDFIALRDNVLETIKNKSIEDIGELKHVFSMFLFFIKKELTSITKDELKKYANETLGELLKKGKLKKEKDTLDKIMNQQGTHGLMFYENDNKDFLEFVKTIERKINEAEISTYASKAKELLDLLKNKPLIFCNNITIGNLEENKYYDIPVLNYLNITEFYNTLLSQDTRFEIIHAFKKRYAQLHNFTILSEEIDLINKVLFNAEENLRKKDVGILDKYFIKKCLIPELNDIVTDINKIKSQTQ